MNRFHPALLLFAAAAAAAGASASPAAAPSACQASSGASAPTVVELYTSEGCSSCPPADRWLSTLKGRSDVLTLAFHVNYWDHLGWPDRFATPEATARQYQLSRWNGSSSVYTPQVVVAGRDSRAGVALPRAGTPGPVPLSLRRDGDVVSVQVGAATSGPAWLDGYWAVLEDGHVSRVRAGENRGETLQHDSVVRLYKPVAAWSAAAGLQAQLNVAPGVAATPRRIAFVVTDATTHRPLQALALGC